MSMDKIFGIAGTALNAQLTRMNSTASNLANAGTVATNEQDAFRAKRPVFKALMSEEMTNPGAADDTAPPRRVSDPTNPLADKDGYVYQSNVSEVTEMVEMMAAARSYQNNVEVINTARQLMMRTLDISKA
jgi:flagellar basal-body rod protein FlgC